MKKVVVVNEIFGKKFLCIKFCRKVKFYIRSSSSIWWWEFSVIDESEIEVVLSFKKVYVDGRFGE